MRYKVADWEESSNAVIVETNDDVTPVLFVTGRAKQRRKFAKEVVQKLNLFGELVIALEQMASRFPMAEQTVLSPKMHCLCLQFEDNDECRHTDVLKALKAAKEIGK